jgi:hypothetical protein
MSIVYAATTNYDSHIISMEIRAGQQSDKTSYSRNKTENENYVGFIQMHAGVK